MRHRAILPAVLLVLAVGAAANGATTEPKPKPCPKGMVATTQKATGKQACFQPHMMMVGGAPQPILMPPPKPKPKTN